MSEGMTFRCIHGTLGTEDYCRQCIGRPIPEDIMRRRWANLIERVQLGHSHDDPCRDMNPLFLWADAELSRLREEIEQLKSDIDEEHKELVRRSFQRIQTAMVAALADIAHSYNTCLVGHDEMLRYEKLESSLATLTAEKEKAEGQLCRAREALNVAKELIAFRVPRQFNQSPYEGERTLIVKWQQYLKSGTPTPCPHAAIAERAGDIGTMAKIMSADLVAQREAGDSGYPNLLDTATALSRFLKEGKQR